MQNSAGNAEKEMGVIMDSIEYKTNRLKETAVGIAQDIFQRDSTKNMVDNLTSLLEIINKLTTSIGGLGTAFTGLMAYKGLKGQGIFDVFGTGVSGVKGFKNFFSQPVLTQQGLDLGLTEKSISQLKQYTTLIEQGATRTQAFKQAMVDASPATKAAATEIARGNVSLNQLTTSSRAAAIGMNLLNAAMNAALAFGIALLIRKISDLHHAQEEAIRKSQELAQSAKDHANAQKDEREQLNKLIQQYKELAQSDIAHTIDGHKQLKELQTDIVDLVGHQIDNLDLVNGRLDTQLAILKRIANENLAQAKLDIATAYRLDEQNYRANEFNKNRFSLGGTQEWGYVEERHIVQDVLNELGLGYAENSGGLLSMGFSITFNSDSTVSQQLEAIDEILQRIENDDTMSKDTEVYKGLLATRKELADYVKQQNDDIKAYLDIISVQENDAFTNDIQSYSDYVSARKNIIDNYLGNSIVQDALQNGFLSQSQLEASVDNYLSTLNNLSDYYDEWVRRNTNNYENMSDAEKAWAAEQSQHVESASFAYEDYKDQIEEVEKSVSTLSSAYQKLDDGSITTSDLGSLFKEFPDLVKYSDDTETLKKKIKELNNQNVTNLIKSFVELKSKISDPEQLKQLDGWINYLLKLSNLSVKVSKQVSSADYVKYEEKNIQDIIDKLEKEKDNQNDILDNLKAQKEELENIISQYKQVVDVVTDYIDKSQIEPLEQRKSDVEEYYNAQIEALKAENEERDRNIELQKAQDALANARKTKVRIYNETQGWHAEFDTNAIQNAENELSSLQNEIAIDDLEKQRDSEVKGIEEQIEAWENYKEQWKEQVEQITKADEELTASKILGADWHEKIASQDINVMVNFGSQYQSYNNRLNNQVNVEISNLEKAIKSRENEIAEWKDYKTQLSDINTSITESNDTYLQTLNQFVIDENSTWEQRIEHMRRNAQIIAELNGQASEVPEIDAESALTGSNLWGIARDGNVLKLYASESEAKADKENIVKDLVRKQIAPGMPSDVIETITKRIMESLEIKQYARGGINTNTGLAWLDGTRANSEVVFNSSQASELYDMVKNGNFGKMVAENILTNMQNAFASLINRNKSADKINQLSISFPNAQINARDYDTFKGFMDRYTNDLLLKMQVGL